MQHYKLSPTLSDGIQVKRYLFKGKKKAEDVIIEAPSEFKALIKFMKSAKHNRIGWIRFHIYPLGND